MSKIANIGMSGAGTLVPLHVGGVTALLDHVSIGALAGVSAGAIVAAALAVGHTPSQLSQLMDAADYKKLIPIDELEAPFRGSLASSDNAAAFIREFTMGQNLGDCAVPLTCVSGDLYTGKLVEFSTKETPDMPIWEAVLCSMSIPDVFPPHKGRYVDGGTMCNLPTSFLPIGPRSIGLRVTEASKVGPIDGFLDEQERLLSMILSAGEADLVALAMSTGIPIIDEPGGNVGFLNREMTQAQRNVLYQAGYNAVSEWLASPSGKEWLS